MKIYRIFEEHSFNPENNSIEIKQCVHSAEYHRSNNAMCALICEILIFCAFAIAFVSGILLPLITSEALYFIFMVFSVFIYVLARNVKEWREDEECKDIEEQKLWVKEELQEFESQRQAALEAGIWRTAHPLEERCRLAMDGNPNAAAELIQYIQSHKTTL